jgi:MoxR-like ATPase
MSWRIALNEPNGANRDRHARVTAALSPAAQDHEHYVATEEIVEALNTALSLGKPLLVSGRPGSGKTRLAYWTAARLGLFEDLEQTRPEVLRFDVQSTTKGQDLLYRYDAIGHFRAASLAPENQKAGIAARTFVELAALGRGIALAGDGTAAYGGELTAFLASALPIEHEARMSVVLVDEIDKAPKDVPNDLLRAFDEMAFPIPELGADALVESRSGRRPLVIVTTNNERALPDAFLRRCCFLHIDFPGEDRLREIIAAQLRETWTDSALGGDVIRLVLALRDPKAGLRKPPGVAELLDYLFELRAQGADPASRLTGIAGAARLAGTVFGKEESDLEKIRRTFAELGDGR